MACGEHHRFSFTPNRKLSVVLADFANRNASKAARCARTPKRFAATRTPKLQGHASGMATEDQDPRHYPDTPPETMNVIAFVGSTATELTRAAGTRKTFPAKLYDWGK